MRVNSLNLQILLVLSYITATLANGLTINIIPMLGSPAVVIEQL